MRHVKVFLAPGLFKNIKRSVIDGVIISEMDIVDPLLKERILREYQRDVIKLWAFKETLYNLWNSMSEGDFILFYNSGKFLYSGRARFKYPFEDIPGQVENGSRLAESIWGRDVDGRTWPYIVFLRDVKEIDLMLLKFNELTGYNVNSIRKSMKVREERATRLIDYLQQIYLKTLRESELKPITKEVESAEVKHEQVVDVIFGLGELIGYRPERRWRHEGYEFDVVWFKPPRVGPKYVFEVHIRGNLEAALLRLKHAHDLWESQIFLISTGDKLKEAQTKFLGELHELKDKIVLVDIKSITEFYEFKGKYEWLERKLGLRPS